MRQVIDVGNFDPEWDGARASASTEPYRALWRAVVLGALKDALEFKSDAIEWLAEGDDARSVSERAGIEIDYVRPRLKSLLVLSATSVARNREAKVAERPARHDQCGGAGCGRCNGGKIKRKYIEWGKPSAGKRDRAEAFLLSKRGLEMRASAKLPASQFHRDRLYGRAILVSRIRSEEDEA